MNEEQMARYIFELNRIDLSGLNGSELLKFEIAKAISLRSINLVFIDKSRNNNFVEDAYWNEVVNIIKKL